MSERIDITNDFTIAAHKINNAIHFTKVIAKWDTYETELTHAWGECDEDGLWHLKANGKDGKEHCVGNALIYAVLWNKGE